MPERARDGSLTGMFAHREHPITFKEAMWE
jgi:hypothetical protein